MDRCAGRLGTVAGLEWRVMTISHIEAWRRLTADYIEDQTRCAHDRTVHEPARYGRVWTRCVACGLVLAELPRCVAQTRDRTRCLSVAEDDDRCAVHADRMAEDDVA